MGPPCGGPVVLPGDDSPAVDFSETVVVLMGAASGIAEQGYSVGRDATLLAGIDHHGPACTVNRFCASPLQTLRMAAHAIGAGGSITSPRVARPCPAPASERQ